MVDTTTTVLGLVKQTVGGNRNTWGGILNATIDMIEEAICGRHSILTTGGGTTLTQAQARKRYIDVSGTLVSDATITVPNASKEWLVTNSTSGDFAVLVKTSGGTATSVPAGTTKRNMCDGSNGMAREDKDEVGQMAFFGNSAVPNGWFECDGTTRSRAGRGIDLFTKISTTWGTGNGSTTFTTPDAKTAGKFLRSRSGSVAIATSQSDSNKAHTHGLTAASAASGGAHTHTGTSESGGSHSHTITIDEHGGHAHSVTGGIYGGTNSAGFAGGTPNSQPSSSSVVTVATNTTGITASADTHAGHTHTFTTASGGAHTHTLSGSTDSDGGTEARPTNLSAILCIKY
jgi:microcystin-dependent protein